MRTSCLTFVFGSCVVLATMQPRWLQEWCHAKGKVNLHIKQACEKITGREHLPTQKRIYFGFCEYQMQLGRPFGECIKSLSNRLKSDNKVSQHVSQPKKARGGFFKYFHQYWTPYFLGGSVGRR